MAGSDVREDFSLEGCNTGLINQCQNLEMSEAALLAKICEAFRSYYSSNIMVYCLLVKWSVNTI